MTPVNISLQQLIVLQPTSNMLNNTFVIYSTKSYLSSTTRNPATGCRMTDWTNSGKKENWNEDERNPSQKLIMADKDSSNQISW